MRTRPNKTILVFCPGELYSAGMKMRGVYLAAQRHGFVARLVQPSSAGLPVEAYLDIWKPAGIITDRLQFVPPKKAGVPTVLFDSPQLKMSGVPKVTVGAEAIAEAAYSVLSKFGYGHYAFAGYASDLRERNEDVWSKARATAFRRVLRESGFSGRLHFASPYSFRGDQAEGQRMYAEWIARLPKPCAVFAANDIVADYIVASCMLQRVKVPEEIAVIGVDNDPLVCENSPTPLTSIEPDFRRSGEVAVELLARLINEPSADVADETVGVARVVERSSAKVLARKDDLVRAAVEYLSTHACLGIGVPDVVERMGVSRRTLELAFRSATGHTILDEIRKIRIERVKDLLQHTDDPIADIAHKAGYLSPTTLCGCFRAVTGLTMEEWRRRNR